MTTKEARGYLELLCEEHEGFKVIEKDSFIDLHFLDYGDVVWWWKNYRKLDTGFGIRLSCNLLTTKVGRKILVNKIRSILSQDS